MNGPKPLTKEQKRERKKFVATVKNSIGELLKPVFVKFGYSKRRLDHVVFDENGLILAAFPSEEAARKYQEMRGLVWRDGEWKPPEIANQ